MKNDETVTTMADSVLRMMTEFKTLEDLVENEFGLAGQNPSELPSAPRLEMDAAVVCKMRAAIERGLDSGAYTLQQVAHLVTTILDALEDIDPEVFADEADTNGSDSLDDDEE